jgi:cytidylate kinase
LRKATDAILLDSTHITIDEQVDMIVNLATGKMIEAHRLLLV